MDLLQVLGSSMVATGIAVGAFAVAGLAVGAANLVLWLW